MWVHPTADRLDRAATSTRVIRSDQAQRLVLTAGKRGRVGATGAREGIVRPTPVAPGYVDKRRDDQQSEDDENDDVRIHDRSVNDVVNPVGPVSISEDRP